MENQNSNINDVFQLTRGNLNAIINGLAEAPAKSVYSLISFLNGLHPVSTESAQPALNASEEEKTTEQ